MLLCIIALLDQHSHLEVSLLGNLEDTFLHSNSVPCTLWLPVLPNTPGPRSTKLQKPFALGSPGRRAICPLIGALFYGEKNETESWPLFLVLASCFYHHSEWLKAALLLSFWLIVLNFHLDHLALYCSAGYDSWQHGSQQQKHLP